MLTSQPLYYMSFVHVLMALLHNIEKEFKAFLWGLSAKRRDLHLLSWPKAYSYKHSGGLGLTSLIQRKQLLVCKIDAQLILKP